MSKVTRATRMLDQAGIVYTVHAYDYDADADSIGLQAAQALGVEPQRVLKTLMASVDERVVCAIIASDRELSMKKLAAAFGGKHAQMLKAADAERISGYRVGGISPFGQPRRIPAVFSTQSMTLAEVYLNGGQRGLQVRLDPKDAARVLGAIEATITA